MTRKIIFISSYVYLALPHFIPLLDQFDEFQRIYLHLKDPVSKTHNIKYFFSKYKLKERFDEYYETSEYEFVHYSITNPIQWINRSLKEIRAFRKYQKEILYFLDEINPDAIISGSDLSISDLIVQKWCHQTKKPFIILQCAFLDATMFGSYTKNISYRMKYIIYRKILHLPIIPKQKTFGNESEESHLMLWSKHFVLDTSKSRMYFVGGPAFDSLFSNYKNEKNNFGNILICTEDIDVVLGMEPLLEVLEIYKELMIKYSNFTFYVKVHPREDITKYTSVFESNKFPNVKIVKDTDLYDLFRKSDIQISINSASSLEAIIQGIPIITTTPDSIYSHIKDPFKGEINLSIRTKNEACQILEKSMSEKYWKEFKINREKYLKNLFTVIDGSSAKRVKETVISIIDEYTKT